MIAPVDAISVKQLNDQGDGTVTVTIVDPGGIITSDGSKNRPAIVGDVYSIQATGLVQGRPAGTNGAFERAKKGSSSIVWAPNGPNGKIVIVPLVSDIPNV